MKTPPPDISPRNIGVDWTRAIDDRTACDQINLEKIFMEEWDRENKDSPTMYHGMGIAQLLMIIRAKEALLFDGPQQDTPKDCKKYRDWGEVCVYDLSEREQRIIATIVQWLGTNVGFSFLNRCLRRANYVIQEFEPFVYNPEPEPNPVKVGRFRILELT